MTPPRAIVMKGVLWSPPQHQRMPPSQRPTGHAPATPAPWDPPGRRRLPPLGPSHGTTQGTARTYVSRPATRTIHAQCTCPQAQPYRAGVGEKEGTSVGVGKTGRRSQRRGQTGRRRHTQQHAPLNMSGSRVRARLGEPANPTSFTRFGTWPLADPIWIPKGGFVSPLRPVPQ